MSRVHARFIALAVGVLLLREAGVVPALAQSETIPDLVTLRQAHEKGLNAVAAESEHRFARMKFDYIAALGGVEKVMMSQGNVDGVLAVRSEVERIQQGHETTAAHKKSMPATLLDHRKRYEANIQQIFEELQQKQLRANRQYATNLETLQASLTSRGEIKAAVEVKRERELVLADLPVEVTKTVTPTVKVVVDGALYPRDGLWGYWPLDGDARDASGNGHDGVIRGAKPCQGVNGQAFSFDGNASIEVGRPGFPTGEYTVAGWIRTEHPIQRDDYRTWIDQLDNSGGAFMVGLGDHRVRDGEKGMQYVVWAGEQGLVNIQASDINVRDGRWHHCAVTFKKGRQSLWVNGNLVATSGYNGPLPRTKEQVAIGGHHFGPYHHPWVGDIDEVFIYERALNEQEIGVLAVGLPQRQAPQEPSSPGPSPQGVAQRQAPQEPSPPGPSPQGVADAVVLIQTGRGSGTGFLCTISGTNYVVTNSHVLENASEFRFSLMNQQRLTPERLEQADDRDLVRISIKEQSLPALTLSSAARIGDAVFVYGNSQGQGVVTELRGEVVGVGPDRVEVSARFVPGNSGSPIVNKDGVVIGIATFVTRNLTKNWMTEGTRFAEPRRFGVRVDEGVRWVRVSTKQFLQEGRVLADLDTFLNDCSYIGRRLHERSVKELSSIVEMASTSSSRYHHAEYPQLLKAYSSQIATALVRFRQGHSVSGASVSGSLDAAYLTFRGFNQLPLRQIRQTKWSTRYYGQAAKEFEEIFEDWTEE